MLHDRGADLAVGGATVAVGAATVIAAAPTDDTGPILAFVGALLVALITAYTASRRLRAQLDAEAARLDAQLEAEGNRHRERLTHESRLAGADDLRATLELAITAWEKVVRMTYDLEIVYASLLDDGAPGDVVDHESAMEVLTVRRKFHRDVGRALDQHAALTLRLGVSHPCVIAFETTSIAMDGLADDIASDGLRPVVVPTRERLDRLISLRRAASATVDPLTARSHEALARAESHA